MNKKTILRILYGVVIVILITVLIFQSKKYKNSTESSVAVAKETSNPTVSTETKATETEPTKVEKTDVYNAKEINDYIKGNTQYTGTEKLVFLTFDDGPDLTSTPQILDALKNNGAKGTFFVQGRNINDSTSGVLNRINDEKNGIAIHSYSHDYSYLYPNKVANTAGILEDYKKADAILKQYLGSDYKCGTWRYPGGHMSWSSLETADEELHKLGVDWIDWNTMTGDAEPKSRRPTTAEGMVQTVENGLQYSPTKDIAVVLMHDNKSKTLTIQALPEIIKYFKDNGYKFAIFN